MTVIYLDSAPFTVIACLGLASNADHGEKEWDTGLDTEPLSLFQYQKSRVSAGILKRKIVLDPPA